jgi:phosphate ABC transporter phosphate-binding protein
MSSASGEKKGQGDETETIRHRTSRRGLWAAVVAVIAIVLIVSYGAFSGWFTPQAQQQQPVTLLGAGATFPFPLISKWSTVYHGLTNVQVNYQSIGSGGGITQITQKTVDFGASDAPLTPTERSKAPNLLHIPETIGAVTFVYNLPGVPTGLNLTGPVIAKIFLGNITTWDDPEIVALNPTTNLPSTSIFVVHRSDGSGTTFVWTDYLSKVSSDWASIIGKGKSVSWPVGLGAKGNEGVAGVVAGNANSAGYVELAYATIQKMNFARIQNQAGNYITPTLDSTAAAVSASAATLPQGEADWGNVSITNAPGAQSYPVASFTYLLVYKELNVYGAAMSQERAKALVDFLWWVIHDGQAYAADLVYVSLPSAVVTLNERSIGLITYSGVALHA